MTKVQRDFFEETINSIWKCYKKYAALSHNVFDDNTVIDFVSSVSSTFFVRMLLSELIKIRKKDGSPLDKEDIKELLSIFFEDIENKILQEYFREEK